jgi:hypothetical protein
MRWTLCFALLLPLLAACEPEPPDPWDIEFAPRPAEGTGLFGTAYYVGDSAPFTRGPTRTDLAVFEGNEDVGGLIDEEDEREPLQFAAVDEQGFFYFALEPGTYQICDVYPTFRYCAGVVVPDDGWLRVDPVSTNIGVQWDYGQCRGLACGD